MRLLPRSAKWTWLLAAAAWTVVCAAVWFLLPPRPRATLALDGTHWPRAFSPDGKWFVTESYLSDDSAGFRVWDAATGQPASAMPVMPGIEGHVYFSPDGQWVLVQAATEGNSREYVSIYRVGTGDRITTFTASEIDRPSFSPCESLIALPYSRGGAATVRLLELPSLRVRAELPDALAPVAFSPDGRTLATAGVEDKGGRPLEFFQPYRVLLWDVATARRTASLPLADHPAAALTFSRDGRRLVAFAWSMPGMISTASTFSTLQVWDNATGRELVRAADEVVLPFSRRDLLLTTQRNKLRCRELETGAIRYSVDHGFTQEDATSASVGGPWVAGGGDESTLTDRGREWLREMGLPVRGARDARPCVRLLDAETGKLVARLNGVRAPLLSPDGRTLATTTTDFVTELWDVPLRPPLTWFAIAAVILALPFVGLARQRVRRLRSLAKATP